MKIIIAGAYAIGTYLAQFLSRNDEDITLIDSDEERLAKLVTTTTCSRMKLLPSSVKALKEAGAANADLFIAVTPDQSLNMNCCVFA